MVFEWPFQLLALFGLAVFLIIARLGGERRKILMLIAAIIWMTILVGLIFMGLANLRQSMKFATGTASATAGTAQSLPNAEH